MKVTVEELTKGISKFLQYFLFELLDVTTIDCIEQQVGNCLESKEVGLKFSDYKIRSTILDSNTLKLNLQFYNHDIDFYLARSSE